MIALELIRNNPDEIVARYKKREKNVDLTEILEIDAKRRILQQDVEAKKAQRNKVSAEVPRLKKAGQDVAPIIAEMKALGDEIAVLDKDLSELTNRINYLLMCLPNLPDDDLLAGGKENNKPIYSFGNKTQYDFTPKSHIELCKDLDIIDYERGTKLAGNGAWLYKGDGARLEWALLNYFIDTHYADGYEFILPPHMLNYNCGLGAGQFPKFEDEVYWVDKKAQDSKFMLPTAETALVNIHSGEIFKEDELPKKYFAYTPCYRREAGSYRAEERGMIRGHQFNKVEMVQYCTPAQNKAAFEELVNKACKLVEGLGLHFQLVKLAAGDCSDSMARTYDIEIWIPSMGIYKEVSSVSTANDYQARRNSTKYRDSKTGKTEFVCTLNGSGLATSRVFPALIEQYQNADGSITIPEVLRKYMGGQTVITRKNK